MSLNFNSENLYEPCKLVCRSSETAKFNGLDRTLDSYGHFVMFNFHCLQTVHLQHQQFTRRMLRSEELCGCDRAVV